MNYTPTDLRHPATPAPALDDEQRRDWRLLADADNAATVAILVGATREEAEQEAAAWSYRQRRFAELEPLDIPVIAFNPDGLRAQGGGA